MCVCVCVCVCMYVCMYVYVYMYVYVCVRDFICIIHNELIYEFAINNFVVKIIFSISLF